MLVEASPWDNLWGIGLSETDERAKDPNQWQGENLLGFCLMRVRDVLAKEKSEQAGLNAGKCRACIEWMELIVTLNAPHQRLH